MAQLTAALRVDVDPDSTHPAHENQDDHDHRTHVMEPAEMIISTGSPTVSFRSFRGERGVDAGEGNRLLAVEALGVGT
jgi:hypothetical protein